MDQSSDDEGPAPIPSIGLAKGVVEESTNEDLDGMPLDDIDGEPVIDDIDGTPLDNIDGSPVDGDIDGVPIDEDDIDGEPLSV
jgi:U2-associated protein SR140